MAEGKDHKLMKEAVAVEWEKKGYYTETEKTLPNGVILDLLATRKDKKVGIEIGTLRGADRENRVLEYCDEFVHYPQLGKDNISEYDIPIVAVRFPPALFEAMEEYVSISTYIDRSEFIRDLVFKKLDKCGILDELIEKRQKEEDDIEEG